MVLDGQQCPFCSRRGPRVGREQHGLRRPVGLGLDSHVAVYALCDRGQAHSRLPTPVHWFPMAAVTNDPKLGDLKQHVFIPLRFSRPESQKSTSLGPSQVSTGLPPSETRGEDPSSSWWLPVSLAYGGVTPASKASICPSLGVAGSSVCIQPPSAPSQKASYDGIWGPLIIQDHPLSQNLF